MKVKHITDIVIGDYPWHDHLKEECVSRLENYTSDDLSTNVKATHTGWLWGCDLVQVKKVKKYILNEVRNRCNPLHSIGNPEVKLSVENFWGNVYRKGDYARSHHHHPYFYSFVYFLKSKWYHAPFILSDSKKRIRPKEGRYVIFPSYILHHVPKHRFNDLRITLSGNLNIKK